MVTNSHETLKKLREVTKRAFDQMPKEQADRYSALIMNRPLTPENVTELDQLVEPYTTPEQRAEAEDFAAFFDAGHWATFDQIVTWDQMSLDAQQRAYESLSEAEVAIFNTRDNEGDIPKALREKAAALLAEKATEAEVEAMRKLHAAMVLRDASMDAIADMAAAGDLSIDQKGTIVFPPHSSEDSLEESIKQKLVERGQAAELAPLAKGESLQ
jgi:DNA-binding NarL/FixJ family response regulator